MENSFLRASMLFNNQNEDSSDEEVEIEEEETQLNPEEAIEDSDDDDVPAYLAPTPPQPILPFDENRDYELTNDFHTYIASILNSYYADINGFNLTKRDVNLDETQQLLDMNFGKYTNLPFNNPSQSDHKAITIRDKHSIITQDNLSTILDQENHYLQDQITKNSSNTRNDRIISNINSDFAIDHQGIFWKNPDQRQLFLQSRQLALNNYQDLPDSCLKASKKINTTKEYCTSSSGFCPSNKNDEKSGYFRFKNFFNSAKPYLVHFQLRNLVETIGKNSIIISDRYDIPTEHESQYQYYRNLAKPAQGFAIKQLYPETGDVKIIMDESKLRNSFNQDIQISTITANDDIVVAGSYSSDFLIYNNYNESIYQNILSTNLNGIINIIKLESNLKILLATNDSYLRQFDLLKQKIINYKFPFPINSLTLCPTNDHIKLITGDSLSSLIIDDRISFTKPILSFSNHYDYSFANDWSQYNNNLVVTGSQDGTVVVNDLRTIVVNTPNSDPTTACDHINNGTIANRQGLSERPIYLSTHYKETLGNNNSIRNVKFSGNKNFLYYGECVDNINIINMDDLLRFGEPISGISNQNYSYSSIAPSKNSIPRTQSPFTVSSQCIQSIGKIAGLCVNDSGNGEILTIGLSDDSVGGVLQYEYEASGKCLDFDFF